MTNREKRQLKDIEQMKKNYSVWCVRANLIDLNYGGYKLLMFRENGVFEFYIGDNEHSYKYMFGLPCEQQTSREAIDIAIANVFDYAKLLSD